MNIIKQLEVYHLENRITQVELAKRFDVAFSTVSRWTENDTMYFTLSIERLGEYAIITFMAVQKTIKNEFVY